jgi:hypothetical protein
MVEQITSDDAIKAQPKTLYGKLIEIRKAMPYLKKENENKGQGFSYVSSSQVLQVFRQKADELGVLIIPYIDSAICHKEPGDKQWMTELKIIYTLINTDDPEDVMEIHWYAQGMDMGEKGVGKALTYGEKYFILKLFNIPTDKDDPDAAEPSATPKPAVPKQAEVSVLKRDKPKQEAPKKPKDPNTASTNEERFRLAISRLHDYFESIGQADKIKATVAVYGFKHAHEITDYETQKKVVLDLLNEAGVGSLDSLVYPDTTTKTK